MVTRAIVGSGTTEEVWSGFLDSRVLPPLELDPLLRAERVVVVAAHPDDEVLGAGGLCARLGRDLVLAWATDGEASHPQAPPGVVAGLGARRRRESDAALRRLGVSVAGATWLGLPDSGLRAAADDLAAGLAGLLRPGDAVVAPWRGDGHPDHEACGAAAAAAAAVVGAPLLEYPVWAWHWGTPADRDLPWSRARVLRLTAAETAAKAAAISAFVTQVEPLGTGPELAAVLPPHVVARFTRGSEVMFA